MKKTPAWLILCIIALVAGAALGITNAFTKDIIENQNQSAAHLARFAVMPDAEDFRSVELEPGAQVDSFYEAIKGGEVIGHVVTVTKNGYAGPIEVVVGFNLDKTISAVSCGGSDFAETAGFGQKVKEPAFTSQFAGLTAPLAITIDGGVVDGVSGASISSRAVCDAITTAGEFLN